MPRPQRSTIPAGFIAASPCRGGIAIIGRFLREHVRRYSGLLFVALVFSIPAGALKVAIPISAKLSIESFAENARFAAWQIAIGLVVVSFFKAGFRYGESYLVTRVGQLIVRDVRNRLYQHIQHLPVGFFAENRVGMLMSRITNDVAVLQQATVALGKDFFRPIIEVVALTASALFFTLSSQKDAWAVLAALAAAVFIALPLRTIGRKLKKATVRGQEHMADLNSILEETFTGAKVVRAFGMEDVEYEEFRKTNSRVFHYRMKGAKAKLLASPLMEFAGVASAAAVFAAMSRVMGLPELMGFLVSVGLMYGPIQRLARVAVVWQEAAAALGRVYEVLDTLPEIAEKPDAVELPPFSDKIEFKGVSFRYSPSAEPVLSDINLTIRKNEVVAIVGSSGAGKSTLVDMIPRFYDVSEGAVLIDGHDVRDVTFASLRGQIGIVTQETFLFNDTVANNIRYSRPGATQEEVESAARAAYAHDFIMEMPDGYDTMVGDRGVRLSGGQRQRLAIARALLRDPAILILDEATSALDAESEAVVQKAVGELMKNRTVLIVAHRLSTVIGADKIVVLVDGRIAQVGTHEQLLAEGGPYAELYRMQMPYGAGVAP